MQYLWRQREKESQVRANLEPTLLQGAKKESSSSAPETVYDLCNEESLDKTPKSTVLAPERAHQHSVSDVGGM